MDKHTKIGILDIGFVSSFGVGETSLVSAVSCLNKSEGTYLQASYDPEGFLGKKGLRYLNNGTKLISSMYFQMLEKNAFDSLFENNSERVGVYNGTELINLNDDFEFDLVAKNEGPSYVSPMRAPNTLANVASSFFSMKAGITGPNVTLSGGFNGSLEALNLSAIHIKEDFIDLALVGSVEINSKYHKPFISNAFPKNELAIGCMLGSDTVINDIKASPLGYFLDFSSCTFNETTLKSVVPKLVSALIDTIGLLPEDIHYVYICDEANVWDHQLLTAFLPSLEKIINLSIAFPNCNNALPLLSVASFLLDTPISSPTISWQNPEGEGGNNTRNNALILSFDDSGYCTASIVTKGDH